MEKKKFKFSNIYMVFGSIFVILAMFLTDDNGGIIRNLPFGSSTITFLLFASASVVGVSVFYISWKACMDYVNFRDIYKKIMEDKGGLPAALFYVGTSIFAVAISNVVSKFF